MHKFNKLSRAEMKNVLGGSKQDPFTAADCEGTVTCGDGKKLSGIFNCMDMSFGEDGDIACNFGGHGDSTSCDCG